MDESTDAPGDIAIAKAKHAAYYRRDTKFHEDLLANGNNIVLSLHNSLPIESGVQLIYQDKNIGAIGISGAGSTDDGLIATAAASFYCRSKLQVERKAMKPVTPTYACFGCV